MTRSLDAPADGAVDGFAEHRDLVFAVSYELLGSAAEAEDVVHEVYLRWRRVERASVGRPRAYLAKIATRQALNRLRTIARRREDYVGPWLPEPLVDERDPSQALALGEAVSMAMMLVLDTLSPEQRAVFVLREVFGFDHGEIAEAVGKSVAAVRQVAHRAREHVEQRRPRFDTDRERARTVVERFVAAAAGGDLQALMDVLAPDVVFISDGGGKVKAALRPIHTADKVARFLLGVVAKQGGPSSVRAATVNARPGILIELDGVLGVVASFEVAADKVARIYFVSNPEKLAAATGLPRTLA